MIEIEISQEVYEILELMKEPDETCNDVIKWLLELGGYL